MRRDAGVASALLNTSQQVGGSIGLALLSTLALSAQQASIDDARHCSRMASRSPSRSWMGSTLATCGAPILLAARRAHRVRAGTHQEARVPRRRRGRGARPGDLGHFQTAHFAARGAEDNGSVLNHDPIPDSYRHLLRLRACCVVGHRPHPRGLHAGLPRGPHRRGRDLRADSGDPVAADLQDRRQERERADGRRGPHLDVRRAVAHHDLHRRRRPQHHGSDGLAARHACSCGSSRQSPVGCCR